ncbi:hypothetical protein JR065_10190, partial [Xanthomonas sp. AmX2]|uniref:hypothetical protein n=1 Tax=Xanthomonas sp. TaxID=29446 RepID=UPI00197DEC11
MSQSMKARWRNNAPRAAMLAAVLGLLPLHAAAQAEPAAAADAAAPLEAAIPAPPALPAPPAPPA